MENANRRPEGEAVAVRGGGVFEGTGGGAGAGDSDRGKAWRGDFGLKMPKNPPLTG
jgi:hypothetical protein